MLANPRPQAKKSNVSRTDKFEFPIEGVPNFDQSDTPEQTSPDEIIESSRLRTAAIVISSAGLVSACLITAQNTDLVRYISP